MKEPPHYHGHRQRLKEKFASGGVLADYELLELLLFHAIPRADVKPIAKELIQRFGNLQSIFTADIELLREVKGIGESVIHLFKLVHTLRVRSQQQELQSKSFIHNEKDVIRYCRDKIGFEPVEHLMAIFLDNKNGIIADEILQTGTVDSAPLYPREVLKRALALNASSIVLAHNHPSGDPKPSAADILSTEEVQKGAKALGIQLHDHIIIGKDDHVSLRALGCLA